MKGIKVFTNTSLENVHSSGHGNEEELKLMIRLIKPKYFMPFHGEYRMLKKHADIGVMCGMPKENTFVLGNGEMLSINKGIVKRGEIIQAEDVYVDGNRIGDVSTAVMKDRKIMANDGIIIVIANIDTNKTSLLGNPNIITRGFVLVNENEQLLKNLEKISKTAIISKLKAPINYNDIKQEIINSISSYAFTKTGRKPIVLPVIMDIKKS